MTPKEIRDIADALEAAIGTPNALVMVSVTDDLGEGCVRVAVYPDGIIDGMLFVTNGHSFYEALHNAERLYREKAAERRNSEVRKLALKIIDIADEYGECTHATLRMAGYTQERIDDLGADACERACQMAERGPFCIVTYDNRPNSDGTETEVIDPQTAAEDQDRAYSYV